MKYLLVKVIFRSETSEVAGEGGVADGVGHGEADPGDETLLADGGVLGAAL